jgi:hypothetical protein
MILFPLLLIPISTWNETFWAFFHDTPIFLWVAQLGMIFFFAALITLGISTLIVLFGS